MKKAAVIGSLNYDTSLTLERMPQPGETIPATGITLNPGGKGANQAAALAKLGCSVWMAGAVGRDAPGDAYRRRADGQKPAALPDGAAAAAGAGTGGADAAGRGAGRLFQRLDGPVAGGVAAGDGLFRRHRLLHRPGDREGRPGGGFPDGCGGGGNA